MMWPWGCLYIIDRALAGILRLTCSEQTELEKSSVLSNIYKLCANVCVVAMAVKAVQCECNGLSVTPSLNF
jgi:hypothetical protein